MCINEEEENLNALFYFSASWLKSYYYIISIIHNIWVDMIDLYS